MKGRCYLYIHCQFKLFFFLIRKNFEKHFLDFSFRKCQSQVAVCATSKLQFAFVEVVNFTFLIYPVDHYPVVEAGVFSILVTWVTAGHWT